MSLRARRSVGGRCRTSLAASLILGGALLLAGFARASAPAPTVLVDAPLVLSASPASSGAGTEVLAWPSLRAGGLWPLVGPLVVGGDLALSATWASAGTDVVAMSRLLGGMDARALAGLSFGGRFARVAPYAYGGGFGAAGPSFVRGGNESDMRLILVGGVRGGLGVLFDIGWIGVRGEVGAGITRGRPETTASVGLGIAL